MDKHKDALIDLIEPDFGLLDALLANGLLCNRKYAEVRSMPTVYKRNERLLKFILTHKGEDKFDRFIEALELTSQFHVVNFIKKNGIKREDIHDIWPLSSKERLILNRNRFHLVNWIDPDNGLITGLLSDGVISQRQSEFILSCPPRSEKVEALLEILLRRSTRDLNVTVECLKEVYQGHVANLLCKDGVILRIHVKNTEKFESKILPQLLDIISGRSADERWKIVELLELSNEDIYVVFVERSASIILYFYCLSSKCLDHLYGLWKSGRLTEDAEKTFRRMTSEEGDMKIELELNVVEYDRLRKQLVENEVDLERQISSGSPMLEAAVENATGLEATSLETTDREFLQMFLDLDLKVMTCAEELHEAVDIQIQSLQEEMSSLKENFLELVRSRSMELPNPSEELEVVGKEKLRATGKGRSLSTGCSSKSEMEDYYSDSNRSPIKYASSLDDSQKKLNSASSGTYQPTDIEEAQDICACVKLEDLDTKEQISFGIAYFLEKFYVICLESNTILTYKSSSPFNLEEGVTVEGLKSPHDIAASHTSLYITDSSKGRIWKIDASHRSCCWMEEVGEPHTISVTPNQEVLMVNSGKPSSVKFFGSDATLHRSFSLPSRITKPTHAVALADGHVILSHGGVGSREQEICELSAHGEVIRAFPSDSTNPSYLSRPCHLAVDLVKGFVFVADFWNRRILILNAKFEPVAEIPRKSESPWRLCYVPELQQLLVGADSTVEVYNVLAKA